MTHVYFRKKDCFNVLIPLMTSNDLIMTSNDPNDLIMTSNDLQ